MRRVILATPSYDGKVHVEFMHALFGTLSLAAEYGMVLFPVQICHDALVQRVRNDFLRMALESDIDDLVFIDGDEIWDPKDVFKLLNYDVDVVGAAVPKKSDDNIDWNVKLLPGGWLSPVGGLHEVLSVGTGFLRISRKAMQDVWAFSTPYTDHRGECRMAFDVQVMDGSMISEDNVFCRKWAALGNSVWVDPGIHVNHIGIKTFTHSFAQYVTRLELRAA